MYIASETNLSEEQKKQKAKHKALDELFTSFKANVKIKEFIGVFKDKMKSHMKIKPQQEIKPFLSNFKNLLDQHKEKFWKQAKIDLVEDNYDQFVIFAIREMFNDRLFICKFLEYAMVQQFSTIEQIRECIIVRRQSKASRGNQQETQENSKEVKEDASLCIEGCAKLVEKIVDKVVSKLSKQSRPNKLGTLQKDINNQINNTRDNKKTTETEKNMINLHNDMNDKIISILEDLSLIQLDKTVAGCPIKYSDPIIDCYNNSKKYQQFDIIIKSKCDEMLKN